jgi:hypothetical protein
MRRAARLYVQCAGDSAGDGRLESLSHVFMHCPVMQPAVEWLRALWGHVVEGRMLAHVSMDAAGLAALSPK